MDYVQTWALLGVFASIMVGGMALIAASTNRVIRATVGGLQSEMRGRFEVVDARFAAVDARFGGVDAKFEAMDAKFEAMDAKFDALRGEMNARFDAVGAQIGHLDRDVTALTKRYFGGQPEG